MPQVVGQSVSQLVWHSVTQQKVDPEDGGLPKTIENKHQNFALHLFAVKRSCFLAVRSLSIVGNAPIVAPYSLEQIVS